MNQPLKEAGLIWLKSHWRWAGFNLFAVSVSVYVLRQGSTGWDNMDTFDSGLASGKWAIRFLLICLMMSPLNTYFGWKGGIQLRKSAGLWAFGFASLHVFVFLRDGQFQWLIPIPDFLALGIVGMGILILLAVTSNRWSMKRLGKKWKQIHRRVYLAGAAVVAHAMLATEMSKKVMIRDPEAIGELKTYAAVLCVLLVVRIPLVRELLVQIPALLKRGRRSMGPVKLPDDAKVFPQIHGRESGVSIQPTFIISNTTSNQPRANDIDGLSDRVVKAPSEQTLIEEEAESR